MKLDEKTWSLKGNWLQKAHHFVVSLLSDLESSTLRQWCRAAGLSCWMIRALDLPLVVLDPIIEWLARSVSRISDPIQFDLPARPWDSALRRFDGIARLLSLPPISRRRLAGAPVVRAYADCSLSATGVLVFPQLLLSEGFVKTHTFSRKISSREILWGEYLASFHTLEDLGAVLPFPVEVELIVDNGALRWSVEKTRVAHFRAALVLRDIFQFLGARQWTLRVSWCSSEENPADSPSRGHPFTSWSSYHEPSHLSFGRRLGASKTVHPESIPPDVREMFLL